MTNLYESLLERTNGHEYNGYFSICCPFHDDHKPSMFVYEDGCFCRTCNKSWSLKQLDAKLGSHFSPTRSNTVSNILPSWSKWGDSLDEIAEKAHKTLVRYPQFQGYLKKRKCEKFIERGSLGYLGGWLTIPVYSSDGRLLDMVCRAIKGKKDTRYVLKPSKIEIRPLFCPNWGIVGQAREIYVVFGIMDAIGLSLLGLPVCTGITGKSINPELIEKLGKRGWIIPDRGEEEDAHKLANQLGWKWRVKELKYPSDVKDPAGVREVYGDEYLLDLIGV